jgi:hypothetical protein
MSNEQFRQPQVGELAPDFVLPAVGGNAANLTSCLKPVSLVFLRHLA